MTISRRDFLKNSSVAGLATIATQNVVFSTTTAKTRVVIVKDTKCVANGTADAKLVQDMVDYGIMALTGKGTKGEAYQALFPKAITTSTKILIKRNDISGKGAVNAVVANAFKTGLSSMLNGTFPAANVTIQCKAGSIKTLIAANDYLINCPVCWMHGSDYGVTLSLKNTMPYLQDASAVHSSPKTWLHTNSLDSTVKPKQVITLLDALIGNNQTGPGTSSTFTAYTLIISRDLVAADYNALRLMEKQSSPNTSQISTGDNQLKAAQTAGLGTCTPANMEIINISPPFTTGIINNSLNEKSTLQVTTHVLGDRIEFITPSAGQRGAELYIFDMTGAMVWQRSTESNELITWNKRSSSGSLVPAGMYIYRVKIGSERFNGTILITQ